MNIRVDLNYPIKDGTEVVFRSPVDCSQVTGLKVYYPGASHEFAFADAHGNNVGDIDHLFAENVVVKVILDITTSMAFVQNADTNAYLENKFVETIDKCCPPLAESGSVVTCQPVEGYPLSVVSQIQPVQEGSGDPAPASWETHTTITGNGQVDLEVTEEMEGCTFRVYDSVSNQPPTVYNPGYTSDVGTVNGKYTEFSIPTNNGWAGMSVFIVPYDEAASEVVFVVEKRNSGNIRPITGHSEVKLWRGGKNLVDFPDYLTPTSAATIRYATQVWFSDFKENTQYSVSCEVLTNDTNNTIFWDWLYTDGTHEYSTGRTITGMSTSTSTAGKTVAKVLFTYASISNVTVRNFQLEVGDTPTPYEPYRGEQFTAQLGQTVYGGSLNWATGELVIGWGKTVFSGALAEGWRRYSNSTNQYDTFANTSCFTAYVPKSIGYANILCNMFKNDGKNTAYLAASATNGLISGYATQNSIYFAWGNVGQTLDEWKAWLAEQYAKGTPVEVVYELAEPITVQLTPREILALSGENTLYSDTGDTQVSGKADPTAIIADLYEKIKALQTAAVNNA